MYEVEECIIMEEKKELQRFSNAKRNAILNTSLAFLNYTVLSSGISYTNGVHKAAIVFCSLAAIINVYEMVDSKKKLDTISRNYMLLDEENDIVIEERPKVLIKHN